MPALLVDVHCPADLEYPVASPPPPPPDLVDSRSSSTGQVGDALSRATSAEHASAPSPTIAQESTDAVDERSNDRADPPQSLLRSSPLRHSTSSERLVVDDDDDGDDDAPVVRRRASLSLSLSVAQAIRLNASSPRFLSVRRRSQQDDGNSSPRTTRCAACGMPSFSVDESGAVAFHRLVCPLMVRVARDPKARLSPGAFALRPRRPVVDIIVDVVIDALGSSVPVDLAMHTMFALRSRTREQQILTDTRLDGARLLLTRPYLVQRLRDVGFDVHRNDTGALELVMTSSRDAKNGILCAEAQDRYTTRQYDRWRRMMNNRPQTPPSSPRRVACDVRCADDLSRIYWSLGDVEALDVSFTPMPLAVLPHVLLRTARTSASLTRC